MFSRTSLVASTSSSRPRAVSSRVRGRRLALDVSAVAKAKNADAGRSVHWRKGPERFNAGGTASKDAPRGGKGSGKTTRSQRTNKVYKRYLAGRPTVDDVERASRGDRTKAMGVVEREAPYRLNRADREAWERAKRRGGHGFGNGTGGGGVLEIQSKQTSALAPHRHPLINTHRLYCDAKTALFVVVEQDTSGEDEVVVDLSTLRLERDGPVRARLLQLAADFGEAILAAEDLCAELGEPVDDRAKYLRALDADASADADADADDAHPSIALEALTATTPEAAAAAAAAVAALEAPSEETLAEARAAVEAAASAVRALKDAGATNADPEVREGVSALLAAKEEAARLEAAAEAATPEAVEAAAEAATESAAKTAEEARRMLAECPIHALPERYLRFACADRPTAKALAKAIAAEDVVPLAE